MATNQEIKNALNNYFSLGEINTLCFDLGIPYEDIKRDGKMNTIIALIEYAARMNQTSQLISYINQARPHANLVPSGSGLSQNPEITANPQTSQAPSGGAVYNFHGPVIGSAVGSGNVQAENIAGRDIIIGQEPQTKQAFQDQLAALEALLKQAVDNGELDTDVAESVQEDVASAVKEADKEEPSATRLTGKLAYVQDVLEKSAGVAQAAGKVGSAVLKAAPIVAALVKAASVLF